MTATSEPDAALARALFRARMATLALFFVSGASLGVWAAHIPLLKSGLALGDATLGLCMLAMGVGALVAMPLSGVLIHRFGVVEMCVASGLFLSVALALPPHAPDALLLGATAFLIGIGVGGIDIAMNAHAAAIEQALQRPIMSSIHAFFSIGGLAGAAGAAGLIGLGVSAPYGMALGGLGLAALVAASSLWLRFSDDEPAPEGPALRAPSAAVLGLGALAICSFLCEGAMMEWSAVFLRDVAGAPLALAASGYAASSATMTIGRLFGDRFVAALGPARAVQVSGALAAAAIALIALSPNHWVAYAGILLAGLGLANIVPPLFSAASRTPGLPAAAALSMVAAMGYGGGLVGPPAIGFVSNAIGLRAGFGLLVLAALAIAFFAPAVINRRGRPRSG